MVNGLKMKDSGMFWMARYGMQVVSYLQLIERLIRSEPYCMSCFQASSALKGRVPKVSAAEYLACCHG